MKRVFIAILFLVAGVQLVHAQTAKLSWTDNSNNEDGFRLYRTIGTGAPVMIPIPANTTLFIDSPGTAAVGQDVCYQLSAYSAAGESVKVTASPPCKRFPLAPPVATVPIPPGVIGFEWVCAPPKVYDAASNTCK